MPAWNSVSVRVAATAGLLLLLLAVVLMHDDTASVPEGPLVCEDDGESQQTTAFDRPMPDVALVSTNGSPVMLHELGGEAFTVVLFCSYRCPCSDGYVDRLRSLRDDFTPRGVAFIALDANANETLEGLSSYAVRKEYPLPLFRDDLGVAADELQAQVTPEAFVFDHGWNLRYHGRIDDDKSGFFVEDRSLRSALDTLLQGGQLVVREKISLGCAIVRRPSAPADSAAAGA